ncbi:hypothetical protein BC829DRAFT_418556 [Chytridium lagenaria]|nr:hypothetical protein BC829DRAFT_418556 [Chytridium lagenaria]
MDDILEDVDVKVLMTILRRLYIIIIEWKVVGQPMSERTGDTTFYTTLIECLRPDICTNYGEVECKASREIPGLATDTAYGPELSVGANVGMKRESVAKFIHDEAGLVTSGQTLCTSGCQLRPENGIP